MDKYLLLIILTNGFIWARSSFGKFTSGNFVDTLGPTLTKFASNNPYPWFKSFLTSFAIPNAKIFANLTFWGEAFAALTLTFCAVYLLFVSKKNKAVSALLILGLLTGAFLNLIFWLAAGWTSPSTESLNLLMMLTQAVGFIAVLKSFRKNT